MVRTDSSLSKYLLKTLVSSALILSSVLGCQNSKSASVDFDRFDWKRLESDFPELERLKSVGATLYRKGLCIGCHPLNQRAEQKYSSNCPNHRDHNWLWGGSLQEIFRTIKFGVRSVEPVKATIPCEGSNGVRFFPAKQNTRWAVMPKFEDSLSVVEIQVLAEAVRKLAASQPLGNDEGTLYNEHCASCHGTSGEGNGQFGAPRLSDAYWEVPKAKAYLEEFIAYGGYILTARDRCFDQKGNFSKYSFRNMNAFGECGAGILSRWLNACYNDSEILALAVFVRSISANP